MAADAMGMGAMTRGRGREEQWRDRTRVRGTIVRWDAVSTNETGNETYASSGARKSGRTRSLSAPGAMKPSGGRGTRCRPGESKPLALGAMKPSEVREEAKPPGTGGHETLGEQWRARRTRGIDTPDAGGNETLRSPGGRETSRHRGQ